MLHAAESHLKIKEDNVTAFTITITGIIIIIIISLRLPPAHNHLCHHHQNAALMLRNCKRLTLNQQVKISEDMII